MNKTYKELNTALIKELYDNNIICLDENDFEDTTIDNSDQLVDFINYNLKNGFKISCSEEGFRDDLKDNFLKILANKCLSYALESFISANIDKYMEYHCLNYCIGEYKDSEGNTFYIGIIA